MPKPVLTSEDIAAIRAAFHAGQNDGQIAAMFGMSASWVKARRYELGLRRARQSHNKIIDDPELRAKIEADFDAGLTQEQSAARQGISSASVHKIREEMGLREIGLRPLVRAVNAAWKGRTEHWPVMKVNSKSQVRTRLVGGIPQEQWQKVRA